MLNQIFSSISKKSKRKRLIGLDIGNYSVKALGINFTRTGQKVECLAMVEVPLEKRKNRRDPKLFTELIKDCLAKGRIVDKDVVIMVSGSQVFVRRITMPIMPKEELDEVMPFEVKKHVSFPTDQMAIDYMIVGEKEEDGVNKLDIILVATPRELLEQEISIVRAAGLKPVAVSVAPIVQWKTFTLCNNEKRDNVAAMVDIGYERTVISFFNNGVLEFTRTINLGGNDVTKSLISAPISKGGEELYTLLYDDADALKREHGFPSPTQAGTTKCGIPFTQLSMLMRPFLERLLSEIRSSFDFYMTEFQIPRVEKIIMSGGGAGLKGLGEFLAEDLGIGVELADPFQSADFAGRISKDDFMDVATAFVLPLGLAAWEKGDLSFLRLKKNAAKKKRGLLKSLVAPSCVAVVLMFILYWSVSTELAGVSMDLDNKTKELTSLNPLSIATHTLSAKKKQLQAELASYPLSILRESLDPSSILKNLRLCAPDNTRLEQINVIEQEGKKFVQVSGTAFFLDDRGPAISDFMAALKDSPLFDDVHMVSLEEEESYTIDGLRFRLRCRYNYTGG